MNQQHVFYRADDGSPQLLVGKPEVDPLAAFRSVAKRQQERSALSPTGAVQQPHQLDFSARGNRPSQTP